MSIILPPARHSPRHLHQRLGQLFGIDVRALLEAPGADEPAGPQRFSLDAAAVDLALGFFCVGSVFVTSLEVAFPGQPAFALTPAELTRVRLALREFGAAWRPLNPGQSIERPFP